MTSLDTDSSGTTSSTGDDWLPATRAGRLLAATLVVLTLALIAASALFMTPLLRAAFDDAGSTAALPTLRLAIGAAALLGIVCGIYLCLHGRAILGRGQCPPSGKLIWRRTRVVRGIAAKRLGWSSLAAGIAAIVFCAGMLFYFHHLIDRMTLPQPAMGVIVEPQSRPQPR